MFKLLKHLRLVDYILSLLIIGLTIGQVWCEMELIKKMGQTVGIIQAYYDGLAPLTSSMLWDIGWKMILLSLGIFACVAVINFLASYVSAHFSKRLRSKTFKKVNSFSMEEMNGFSVASLITRSSNDIKQVEQTVYMTLKMAVLAPTMAIFALMEILGSSVELTWSTAIALGIMFAIVIFMIVVVVPKFTKIQKKTDRLNLVTKENLTGLRVVRAYSAEDAQEQKFEGVNADLTKTNLFVNRVTSMLSPAMMLISNGLSLVIYWLGSWLINNNKLVYQSMVTFQQYAMHVLISFMVISMLFIMIPRGIVCARRVRDVLETKTKIHDGENKQEKSEIGSVEFKNVSFRYPDAEVCVLENISFKANKGETVAFIGSTGSGKSTLVNLVPRFFDATEGEILIDGKNIKDYKLEQLNNILGYVPQKGYLFSGTVKSNLLYGNNNATDEQIKNALDIAQANFVYDLEGGVDHEIAQGGTNVSGGQRQRLCIARAVIKNPEIYIFDDSFSALDYKTDKVLRERLNKETADATKLIVAQRIGTIIDADRIIVLDEGKMVGCGTHKELLESCEVYKEIALSQLSKEEL